MVKKRYGHYDTLFLMRQTVLYSLNYIWRRSETGRRTWAATDARGDSSSGAALCPWTSSIPWVRVSPTAPASTSAPMRTCLTGPDRLVCFLLRRRRVSLGRRCWTQRGRGSHSRGRLPCEKLYTE